MRIDNKEERADTIIAATNARRQMNVECTLYSVHSMAKVPRTNRIRNETNPA